jgi:hypothetical protein
MSKGIRIANVFWLLAGLGLCARATWGLVAQSHFQSVVVSWLIVLLYGAIAFFGALLTARLRSSGRYLLTATSVVGLLYVLVYFLFGGLDDAFWYLPGVFGLLALSAYTLVVFSQAKAHAT